MGGSDPRNAVFDRLVHNEEFAQILASRLRLDIKLITCFAIVDTKNRLNHSWNNNHVTKKCLHQVWFI